LLQVPEQTSDTLVGIAKDYVDGNLWIECHVTFEEKGNTYHFFVVIEHGKGEILTREIREAEIEHCCVGRDSPVLVDVAQGIESPKQMALDCFSIPSVVRQKMIDDLDCLCGYSKRKVPKLLGVGFAEDRELCSIGIVNSADLGQGPNKLIQRRAQTIQEVADDERELVGHFSDMKPNDIASIFKVILTGKGARFRLLEGDKAIPQVFKMFLRPGCFQIGIGQTRHMEHPFGVELSS
jgi:hypothetical protein